MAVFWASTKPPPIKPSCLKSFSSLFGQVQLLFQLMDNFWEGRCKILLRNLNFVDHFSRVYVSWDTACSHLTLLPLLIYWFPVQPVSLLQLLMWVLPLPGQQWVRMIVVNSLIASVQFIKSMVPSDRKALAMYPVFLFYLFLSWFIVLWPPHLPNVLNFQLFIITLYS